MLIQKKKEKKRERHVDYYFGEKILEGPAAPTHFPLNHWKNRELKRIDFRKGQKVGAGTGAGFGRQCSRRSVALKGL